MSMTDDDDWIEIEKKSPIAAAMPDVTLRISESGRKRTLRAWVAFRGPAAVAIRQLGMRFRLQVGGAEMERIRLVPDLQRGTFELTESGKFTSLRLSFPMPNVWPAEPRTAVEAKWSEQGGCMVLVLPQDFARASKPALPAAPTAPAPSPAPVAPAFPITTSAAGLEAAQRAYTLAKVGVQRLTPGERRVMSDILANGDVRQQALQELFGCSAGAVQPLIDSLADKLRHAGFSLNNLRGLYTLGAADLADLRKRAEVATL